MGRELLVFGRKEGRAMIMVVTVLLKERDKALLMTDIARRP